jgi:hypothetical protein
VIEPGVYEIEGRSPLARMRTPRPLNVGVGGGPKPGSSKEEVICGSRRYLHATDRVS